MSIAEPVRGVTSISAATVNRVAQAAAGEADGVVKVSASGAPSEQMLLAQRPMRLEVQASVTYPASVANTAAGLRSRVKEQLDHLLGLSGDVRVDVVIDAILPPSSYRSRARVS